MSPTATVLRSRAARFETARWSATAPIGVNPGAVHSAAIGIGSLGSPSLRKQRLTPVAEPVASTATLSTSSRSSSERTFLPIDATSRSRWSASASASAELRPIECERRLGGERLQQRQLVSGEDARRLRRREHEHRGHPLLGDERDEDGALRSAPFGEAAVDLLRARDVVDDDRAAFEDRARDSRRLAVEVDRDARPPVEVSVRAGGEEPLGALGVLADEGDRRPGRRRGARNRCRSGSGRRRACPWPGRARSTARRSRSAGRCPSRARARCRGPQQRLARRLDGSGETASVSQTWDHRAVRMIGRSTPPTPPSAR